MAKPTKTLIATYRHECKAWITKNMLYNYPVGETDGQTSFNPKEIAHIILHNRNAKLLRFHASFSHMSNANGLELLHYPLSPKPHGKKYLVFKLMSVEQESNNRQLGNQGKDFYNKEAVVRLSDFAESNDDKAILSHWLHNKGTSFAKPYENGARKILSKDLVEFLAKGEVVCEYGSQQTFFPELFDIPFPPPENPKFTFIDLFAGIGGFRLAMQREGGKCVFSSEWEENAQKTYLANYGELPFGDITKEEVKKSIPDKFDILCAGFPCQPFSLAGVSARNANNREHGFADKTQGTLFFDIMQIIREKHPRVVFLENVKNLVNHDKKKTFAIIKDALESEGYSFNFRLIDASPLVPQKRIRCYMVCVKSNKPFEFPNISGTPIPLSAVLEKNVDPSYTISDGLWSGHQKRTERNLSRGTGFTAFVADVDKPAHTLVARYYKDGKECLVPQKGKNPRMLTPRECARLQGFPENFILPSARSIAYKQMGNSVAVPVLNCIAASISKQLL